MHHLLSENVSYESKRNLQFLEEVYQMESAFPRNISTSAHEIS